MKNKRASALLDEQAVVAMLVIVVIILACQYSSNGGGGIKKTCDIPKTECAYYRCMGEHSVLIAMSNNYYLQYQNCLLEKTNNNKTNTNEAIYLE